MHYSVLSSEEGKILESTPFNPPRFDEQFTRKMFDDEWWGVRAALKEHLSKRAVPNKNSESWGDFSLSENRGNSRWIYITFHTPRLWKKDFCQYVGSFLQTLEKEYCIACITEMQSKWNLFTKPFVYLVITRNSAKGSCQRMKLPSLESVPHDKYLRRFGFPV